MQKTFLTKKSSYYYDLPEEQIAQWPAQRRTQSRLMVVKKDTQEIIHTQFNQLYNYLQKTDLLVLNKTKVLPARIFGKKTTGANVEVFLLKQVKDSIWECLVKPGRKLKTGVKVIFSNTFEAEVIAEVEEGKRHLLFKHENDFYAELDKCGTTPLPPYIKRKAIEEDKNTYQTVYAKNYGSVAAPTAGLHFTDEYIEKLKQQGVSFAEVCLHVGLGTFRPVKTDDILQHKMHTEYCEISSQTATAINTAKKNKHRIIAVGTTTTRTLESLADNGLVSSGAKNTDLFIYPGKELQIIDGLLTNFHMPESTLLMLVSAFAAKQNGQIKPEEGYNLIMKAYKQAVEQKYRFFSYGDSMLII